MSYRCPNCTFGTLKPAKVTYLRRWGDHMITLPNFQAWQCDSCGYTRYDGAALAQVELVFGPDVESLMESPLLRYRTGSGPAERGPERWPS